jgi:hypothetical protein
MSDVTERPSPKYIRALAKVAKDEGIRRVVVGDIVLEMSPVAGRPVAQAVSRDPFEGEQPQRKRPAPDELDVDAIEQDERYHNFVNFGVSPVGN